MLRFINNFCYFPKPVDTIVLNNHKREKSLIKCTDNKKKSFLVLCQYDKHDATIVFTVNRVQAVYKLYIKTIQGFQGN